MHCSDLTGVVRRTRALALTLPAFILFAAALSTASLADQGERVLIRVQQAQFDPLDGFSRLPPEGVYDSAPRAGDNYYLVQFQGPVRPEWRQRLVAEGAVILDYVPDFAFIVRFDRDAQARFAALPAVRWVGLFPPAFRLSNDLRDTAGKAAPGTLFDIVVRGFPGETGLPSRLAAAGAIVTESGTDGAGGGIHRVSAPAAVLHDLAREPGIAWIEPDYEPTYFNEVARDNAAMRKNQVESVLGLYGADQIVAVGDSGVSTGNAATVHQDFEGRVFAGNTGPGSSCGGWADNHSHGTHVAGSVLGSGFHSGADITNSDYAGSNAGIAPEALLYAWSFCNNFSGLPDPPYDNYYGVIRNSDPRARINTNSWGFTSGHGQYNAFTRETDRFVWDFPDMVLLYAAGNDGRDTNANGVVNPGSMAMPGTGKNIITVGASENLRMTGGYNPGGACSTWGGCWSTSFPAAPINGDRLSDNLEGMAAFSGRGPTSSGRLKPDIVAPGSNIVSTRNESTGTGWGIFDAHYIYNGGTSMATPLVAGASAIVREFYEVNYGVQPGAALVKATLINGAFDMTPGQYGAGATRDVTARPDINQGWGRVDLANSLIYDDDRRLWFEEHAGLNTGESYSTDLYIADGTPVRVTLAWTDYPGTEVTHGALVNDLDLLVEAPDGSYHGNHMMNGDTADRVNNIEGVDLNTPVQGLYTITVTGFNVPEGPQPFALVITGAFGDIVVDPGSAALCAADGSADYTVTLGNNFTGQTELGVSGLPAGTSGAFNPNPVAFPADESLFTLSDLQLAPAGDYLLTFTATDLADPSSTATAVSALTLYAGSTGPITLQSPADGATDTGLQPAFAWDPDQTQSYQLQVAGNATFDTPVIDVTLAATSYIHDDELATGTDYYWRVRGINPCGDGEWSAARQFQTRFEPLLDLSPGAFSFEAPQGGSDGDTLLISNVGTGHLVWSIETDQPASAPDLLQHDPALDEVLDLPDFSVISFANGGSAVAFQVDAGILTRGDVVGFSFSGNATGITGDNTWASDTCMLLEAPDGATYGVGGIDFPSTGTPGCGNTHSWDFQGGQSTGDGLYQSSHDDVFDPPVNDMGEWTVTFLHDWNNANAATINWSGVTVTLHKQPLPACGDELTHVAWLSANPSSGSTPQGQTDAVSVVANAAGLAAGDYAGYLCVTTNDQSNPLTPIPVELTVTGDSAGPAELSVAPTTLDFGLVEIGLPGTLSLTVTNAGGTGAAALTIQEITVTGGAGAFTITGGTCQPGGAILAPGMQCVAEVTFDPVTEGDFQGEIQIQTGDGQSDTVTLTGQAVAQEDEVFSDRFEQG